MLKKQQKKRIIEINGNATSTQCEKHQLEYCMVFMVNVLNIDHLLSDELKRTIGGPDQHNPTYILCFFSSLLLLYFCCCCCCWFRHHFHRFLNSSLSLKCYSVYFHFILHSRAFSTSHARAHAKNKIPFLVMPIRLVQRKKRQTQTNIKRYNSHDAWLHLPTL